MQNTFSNSQRIALVIIFIFALGIRLNNLKQAPLDFHPTREYRSILNSRDIYQQRHGLNQDQLKIRAESDFLLEPPILESIASWSYEILDEDSLWISRLLNILFWVTSGYFLCRFAAELYNAEGAILSSTLFLFLPFSIQSSRAFLPEPLTSFFFTLTLWALIRYRNNPHLKQLIVASLAAAATLYVKTGFYAFTLMPMALVLIVFAKQEVSVAQKFKSIALFFAIALTPASFYILSTSQMMAYMSSAENGGLFFPQLIFTSSFWKGMFLLCDHVYTIPVMVLGVFGFAIDKNCQSKLLLLAGTIGFSLFCIYFTYHSHTHDYYHMQFIPIICLAAAPLALPVWKGILKHSLSKPLIYMLCFVLMLSGIREGRLMIKKVSRGVSIAAKYSEFVTIKNEKEMLERVGQEVNHSPHCIILSHSYGFPLMYHGRLAGRTWLKKADISYMKMSKMKVKDLSIEEEIYDNTKFTPEYFIATDLKTFSEELKLMNWLQKNAVLQEQNSRYMIYKLAARKK
jgi:4-amino-4-deoxy-L-arabinose transferase-like glycosyltransferase